MRSVPGVSFAVVALAVFLLFLTSCSSSFQDAASPDNTQVHSRGTVEVTARLMEIPEGAIFQRDLYDYATILKYEVVEVHRGEVPRKTIFAGHYNPWKPRLEAADKYVPEVGGTLREFRTGDTHRLALELPIDDHYMGGIVNKYFGQHTGLLYWAVWTDPAED